jgi:hypothetical protein
MTEGNAIVRANNISIGQRRAGQNNASRNNGSGFPQKCSTINSRRLTHGFLLRSKLFKA